MDRQWLREVIGKNDRMTSVELIINRFKKVIKNLKSNQINQFKVHDTVWLISNDTIVEMIVSKVTQSICIKRPDVITTYQCIYSYTKPQNYLCFSSYEIGIKAFKTKEDLVQKWIKENS